MKRRQFDYYCFKRQISVLDDTTIKPAVYYVGVRLEDALLYDKDVRTIVGFINRTEIPTSERGVSLDLERTFHCAASKRLLGHLGFTLEFTGTEGEEYPQWGKSIDTSIAYNKSLLYSQIESQLYAHTFKPSGSSATYQIVPGSIRPRSRRGER